MSELMQQLDETPEVIPPEQEQADVPVQEEQVAQAESPAQEAPKETFQERNWRQARARMEEKERQNQLLMQQLELMQRQLQEIRGSTQKAEEPEEEYYTDSEKRLANKIKALESRLESQQAKEADLVVDRLRARFPDFDAVVNHENISYLQTNNAPLAKAIAALKADPYEQGLAAYDVLKRTDWYQERQTMQDKAKLEENSKKPMSVQAVRKQGALAEANRFAGGLTPELKKQLQKEMAEARKGA